MLTKNDIRFLLEVLEVAPLTGMRAHLKASEVFIKLNKMIKKEES